MPLRNGTSKAAFSDNVSTEMKNGRAQDQALAIAFSKRREAERRRKLWHGGMVPKRTEKDEEPADIPASIAGGYAFGGSVALDRQDDDLDVMNHIDTTGEPHTRDLDDEVHPMEYLADGGEVEDDDETMPGESTRDVMPESYPTPGSRFHQVLKRRPRRMY